MASLNAVYTCGKHKAKERNSKRHKLSGAYTVPLSDNLCAAPHCQISHWCNKKLCVTRGYS